MKREVNFLDKLGSLIPGYNGYSERESRRNCDKLLRQTITKKLDDVEKKVSNRIEESINKKDLDSMRKFESCRKDLNTLISEIKYAPYGSSALFTDMQLKEDELEQVYKYDIAMMELANHLESNYATCEASHMIDSTNLLRSKLKERNEFISSYK